MSMDEKDLKKLAQEQSAEIEIPDSLQPEQIERLLESRGKKKRKQYYGKLIAAAACGLLVVGVAAAGAGGLGSGTGSKSDVMEYQAAADSGETAAADAGAGSTEETADTAGGGAGSTGSSMAEAKESDAGGQSEKTGSGTGGQSEKIESGTGGQSEKIESGAEGRRFEVTKIKTAENYDEIYGYIEAENKRIQEMQKAAEENYEAIEDTADGGMSGGSAKMESTLMDEAASTDTATEAGGASGYSDTNVREEGVGEADIVKTDGKRLYIANNQQIQIVGIEKEEMEHLSTIRLDQECYVSEIFVKGDRLIAVYSQSEYRDQGDVSTGEYGGIYLQYAVAETFDISRPKEPKSLGKVSQSGNYNTMRVSGDYVYLFSDFYTEIYGAKSELDGYIPRVQGKQVASGDILMPMGSRATKYTIISAFSIKDPEKKVDTKAVFGSAGMCYVSRENIYICESDYGDYGIMPLARQGGSGSGQDVARTSIRKLSYKNGKLKAVGQTEVDGTLNDSFSIDEYEGNLRLVVTVTPLSGSSGGNLRLFRLDDTAEPGPEQKESNSLYILDEKLEELSRIEGLAEDEIVYSARFMGDTGFFVTFRQVDPLFSVDLSDPKNPEILGKLKIPGFSEYLHPYGEGQLLGIGMDVDETGTTTEGVKLSMFDISDPENVTEAEKYVLENTYSSDVFYDYKAALVDVEKNLIGFRVDGDTMRYVIFAYDEKNGFECLFERELSGYAWNARALYSGSRLYLTAGNTVESFDLKTFQKIDDIVL